MQSVRHTLSCHHPLEDYRVNYLDAGKTVSRKYDSHRVSNLAIWQQHCFSAR